MNRHLKYLSFLLLRSGTELKGYSQLNKRYGASERGFALPMAVGMGMIMTLVGTTMIMKSQEDQVTASVQKETARSLAVVEGGIARTLSQLNQPNNRALLGGNYDPANPSNGNMQYLGSDGIPRSNDETTTVISSWMTGSTGGGGTTTSACSSSGSSSGTPNITTSPVSLGGGSYTIKAYRYNGSNQGSLLVEGRHGSATSWAWVRMPVQQAWENFPGVLAIRKMELYGRSVVGSNANVYYDPAFSTNSSLTGSSAPGATNRGQYLNAIKSGSSDSITGDRISGKIIACKLTPTWSSTPPAGASVTNVGDISLTNGGNGTTRNFSSTNTTLSSTITYIRTGSIDLNNNNKIDVNTTNGPVYIYVTNGSLQVNGNSKIRNIRTDGVAPKVGDLRIILATSGQSIQTYGSSCIDTAFVYVPGGNIQQGGSGDGCTAHPGNSNIHGVLWAQSITNTSGDYSGVSIPDDVSSLADLIGSLGLPASYKFNGSITSWQRQEAQ